MKRLFALLTLLLTVMAAPALAISLDAAKAQGLVGERQDGYIGAVASNPTKEVATLVSNINTARKDEYQKIAARNGQPLSVVEKLAAVKLLERVGSGEFYMDKGGNWVKR